MTTPSPNPALLVLEDGTVFSGIAVGADGMAVGEVVFNTAMSGYQEILTDPSYAQQIVTLTYPHIGNTGTTPEDDESDRVWAAGLVIRNLPLLASNFRNQQNLDAWLKERNVVAIAEIDTRRLTRILRDKGVKRIGPYRVPRTMGSTVSACLATPFKIKGINYSISSACATSAHCIGSAMEQIQMGKQDMVFAGGGEEEHWSQSMLFDAMGALSTQYNDTPEKASRAYDAKRDGFVIAGGGGMVVVEELEHALARGAKIYAEVVGYGATSDGYDMVAPSGEGAVRCMQQAMATVDGTIDYLNTHGTSTPVGDVAELKAIREVFGDKAPKISSTKSLSGHSLGAAGVQEAIYCMLMMRDNFLTASANIEELDENAADLPILRERLDQAVDLIMSNSFGFGGTNATLVLKRWTGA